jgi:AcrR family transcriptional regulator
MGRDARSKRSTHFVLMVRTIRKTRDERREEALAAAREEFARAGMQASVELIAARAGVTQSYLLRLFGTKKGLYLATVERAFATMLAEYEKATTGLDSDLAYEAIAATHERLIKRDRVLLMEQLQAFAACDDAEVREVVMTGYGRLVERAQAVTGASPERLARLFAYGMLSRVFAAMQATSRSRPGWAQVLDLGGRQDLGITS